MLRPRSRSASMQLRWAYADRGASMHKFADVFPSPGFRIAADVDADEPGGVSAANDRSWVSSGKRETDPGFSGAPLRWNWQPRNHAYAKLHARPSSLFQKASQRYLKF